MVSIKLCETEVFETTRVFDFEDGAVTMFERETYEIYRPERPDLPRLVIEGASEFAKGIIAKTRDEFTELNSVLRELAIR